MTAYEIVMVILEVIGLLISSGLLLVALLNFLDKRWSAMRHADSGQTLCVCPLSRRSPYAFSHECACLCASTRQSPSAHLRMAHHYAQTFSLAERLKATEDLNLRLQ